MRKSNFPNPKLNLPKEIRDSKDESTISSFQAIDQYIELVGQYIHTRIDLDNDPSGTTHTHAWVLKVVSANILRSLHIRNSVVDAINSRNPINLFISLKAWLEVVGVLASILDILESNLTQKELFEKFKPYTVGSRGKGNFRVGTIDAINVQTMLQKGDKYVAKMIADNSDKPLNVSSKAYVTDFYDLASNPSHPSYDAYELVGNLVEEGVWEAKSPDQIKAQIVELLPMYGGLLLSPILIQSICQKIFEIEKEKFSNVKSTKYFD